MLQILNLLQTPQRKTCLHKFCIIFRILKNLEDMLPIVDSNNKITNTFDYNISNIQCSSGDLLEILAANIVKVTGLSKA